MVDSNQKWEWLYLVRSLFSREIPKCWPYLKWKGKGHTPKKESIIPRKRFSLESTRHDVSDVSDAAEILRSITHGSLHQSHSTTSENALSSGEKGPHAGTVSTTSVCQKNVECYLSTFTPIIYKEKGRTLLRNEGIVGYQHIHFDEKNKCNCC